MDKQLLQVMKGKNVLVTGHTGFKGTWLTIWLKELGANVIGYSLDPVTDQDVFVLSDISKGIVDIRGDIRDFHKLKEVFDTYRPEIVFHLAAQPLVKRSYVDPRYTYEVNVMGTMNVLEAIRLSESAKIGIFITSDKCYENKEWYWGYRENDPVGGYDPYSSSKGCCELLVASYRNSYFHVDEFTLHQKAIATVRAGNVIGGGDWSQDRIIPDAIRALQSDGKINIRSPHSIRPWQHVIEPIRGYLQLAVKLVEEPVAFSGAWNFGPDVSNVTSVEELVSLVISKWRKGTYVFDPNHSHVHEANLLTLDISKAKYELKWQPKWNVEETIDRTIEWYKKYPHENVYDLCVKQINDYYQES
jgi:CDP-glucose 4,6-dehydratase